MLRTAEKASNLTNANQAVRQLNFLRRFATPLHADSRRSFLQWFPESALLAAICFVAMWMPQINIWEANFNHKYGQESSMKLSMLLRFALGYRGTDKSVNDFRPNRGWLARISWGYCRRRGMMAVWLRGLMRGFWRIDRLCQGLGRRRLVRIIKSFVKHIRFYMIQSHK